MGKESYHLNCANGTNHLPAPINFINKETKTNLSASANLWGTVCSHEAGCTSLGLVILLLTQCLASNSSLDTNKIKSASGLLIDETGKDN